MARLRLSQVPSRIRARDIKVGDTVYLRRGTGPDYGLEAVDVKTVKEERGMIVVSSRLSYWPDQLVIGIPA